MAGVPEPTGRSGTDRRNEPEYEVIGGVIDDQPSGFATPTPVARPPRASGTFLMAAAEAWRNTRKSFTSWWFWLACALGIALAWGIATAFVAWAESSGWFEGAVPGAVMVLMSAFVAVSAAVLGTGWGFRHSEGSILVLGVAGALRGVALAGLACAALLLVGFSAGGPIALAGPAVVVILFEVVLFGLIGAGARKCFAKVAPGAALAAALVAFLCVGNVGVTILLLPTTVGLDQASVPVNVQRDDAGRVISYECIGDLRTVEVAHTDRVAWVAASNPALVLGSVGVDVVSTDNPVGWMLSGLQWAADGPSREVPCLGGESSASLAPPMPVSLVGLGTQALIAALVLVPGRWLAARRPRVLPPTEVRSAGPRMPGQG